MRLWNAAILLFAALSVLVAKAYPQVVAPKPEEACQVCAVVDLSQRTRFPDKDRPYEEWVVWCEGCKGAYVEWTLQATFFCRPWNEAEFRSRSVWVCPDDVCGAKESIWLCPTWNPKTARMEGSVKTSCACCLGCGECRTEARPPKADRPRPLAISHGQQVNITVGGTDPDRDLVAVLVMEPAYGRLARRSGPQGDGHRMWVEVTYEPANPCWTGTDSFSFVVCDAHGNTARGQVQIKVVNNPPKVREVFKWITVVAYEENTVRLPEASDPDPGDQEALQYKILLDALPSEAGRWTGVPPLLTFVPQPYCLPFPLPYQVRDSCGAEARGLVLIQVLHRPVVRAPAGPISVFCRRSDAFTVYVDDHDFLCGTLELVLGGEVISYVEKVSLSVKAASGSPVTISPEVLSRGAECTVTYAPGPGVRHDELTIIAVDETGLSTIVRVPLTVDRPPAPIAVPSLVNVRPGETVRVPLKARDPDGDTVTITQTAGPGALIGNTYSWIAEDPYWGPSWRQVRFVLEDPCGGKTYQSFNIRVVQPPKAYDGRVWVPRGRTGTASLYVFDPDTPPGGLKFSFRPPAGLAATVIAVEKPPYYYGSYYGYTARVEVSAGAGLCPGTYPVPFTVTDPDGLSASATLYVHVFGNQPPRVKGELFGETMVTLYPDRVRFSPVVVRGEVFDPDGDEVFAEAPGIGIPSQYAGNLSIFLGSLVSVYFPYPEAKDAYCWAVCNQDVIEDQYTVILRDTCGATTEVPVTVRIRVVDKVPPKIVYPARDRTVECDGKGNAAELSSWLANQGGAWAFDNCSDVTWTNDYSPGKFVTTCGKAGYVTVTFTATDCVKNTSSTTATFRIVDTTPPVLRVPPNITVECDEPTDPSRTGWPTASDVCDSNPQITYTDEVLPGACPQARVIRRTWKATDACGNAASAVQMITVVDTKAPEFTYVPGDMDLGCNPPDTGPNATGRPTIRDNCDPNPQLGYSDAIQPGCKVEITRTWTARDACGNTAQRVQRITYTADTVPPVLTMPPDVNLGCHCVRPDTSPDVTGWAQATDNCDPQPRITYSDTESVNGEFHTIVRTWVATDACGNRAQGVQRILFRIDRTPPSLACPTGVTAYIYGCSASSVWVSFPVSVTDNCDPSPQAWCTPLGGWFTEGTTYVTVEYGARDRCGNEIFRTCTFPVTVIRVNSPPVARSDSTDCNGACSIPVLANDYDPDGDPITIVDVSQPRCGTAWVSGNTVHYTTAGWRCPTPPGPGVTDSFSYTITDGCEYATATVSVYITCEICPMVLPPGGGP